MTDVEAFKFTSDDANQVDVCPFVFFLIGKGNLVIVFLLLKTINFVKPLAWIVMRWKNRMRFTILHKSTPYILSPTHLMYWKQQRFGAPAPFYICKIYLSNCWEVGWFFYRPTPWSSGPSLAGQTKQGITQVEPAATADDDVKEHKILKKMWR